jgi:hypothetical protein
VDLQLTANPSSPDAQEAASGVHGSCGAPKCAGAIGASDRAAAKVRIRPARIARGVGRLPDRVQGSALPHERFRGGSGTRNL